MRRIGRNGKETAQCSKPLDGSRGKVPSSNRNEDVRLELKQMERLVAVVWTC